MGCVCDANCNRIYNIRPPLEAISNSVTLHYYNYPYILLLHRFDVIQTIGPYDPELYIYV